MANTLQSKTFTATLPGNPKATFAWIAKTENLSQWYKELGMIPVRFVRDDRASILDLIMEISPNVELTAAIRVLPNGEGSELVMTLVQPREMPDLDFEEHIRWAASAMDTIQQAPPVELEPESPSASEPSVSAAPPFAPTTGKKLFVGNLPFDWTDEPLRALFAAVGNVAKAEIARFRGRGRSRGFGFVEMASDEEAKTAIEKLHNTLAGTRTIIVHLARSQESRKPAEPSQARPAAPRPPRHPQRPPMARRPDRPRRMERSRPPRREGPPSRDTGIVDNKSGYEIFPLRGSRSFSNPASSGGMHGGRHRGVRSNIEPSPYFNDTGDIENRGPRGPRRRRPRR